MVWADYQFPHLPFSMEDISQWERDEQLGPSTRQDSWFLVFSVSLVSPVGNSAVLCCACCTGSDNTASEDPWDLVVAVGEVKGREDSCPDQAFPLACLYVMFLNFYSGSFEYLHKQRITNWNDRWKNTCLLMGPGPGHIVLWCSVTLVHANQLVVVWKYVCPTWTPLNQVAGNSRYRFCTQGGSHAHPIDCYIWLLHWCFSID